MGVKSCFRNGCDNIMCSRYSSKYGYICYECYAELEASQTLDIRGFMNTPKEKDDELVIHYDKIFKQGE